MSGKRRRDCGEIIRPTAEELAHDPALIAGFEHLARRVLIHAFEDAVRESPEARTFLTVPEDDGLLEHWVKQAGLPVPVSEFCRTAQSCLDHPERLRALFGRALSLPHLTHLRWIEEEPA